MRPRTEGLCDFPLSVSPNLFFVAVILASSGALAEAQWKGSRTIDGLTLELRDVAGSPFEEIKVSTVSSRPLASLCDAVYGRDAKVEGDFKKRVVIRESDSERWTYEQIRVPLVPDRDLVMHTQLLAPATSGRCEVKFETATDPLFPRARGHVRVEAVRGHWLLEPVADGKVAVTYLMFSDPGGRIPAVLVRRGQRAAAISFMKTILARAGQ